MNDISFSQELKLILYTLI